MNVYKKRDKYKMRKFSYMRDDQILAFEGCEIISPIYFFLNVENA